MDLVIPTVSPRCSHWLHREFENTYYTRCGKHLSKKHYELHNSNHGNPHSPEQGMKDPTCYPCRQTKEKDMYTSNNNDKTPSIPFTNTQMLTSLNDISERLERLSADWYTMVRGFADSNGINLEVTLGLEEARATVANAKRAVFERAYEKGKVKIED